MLIRSLPVGLSLDSQRIQLKSLFVKTENFTGFDDEFRSKFCLSVFASTPSEFLKLNFSSQSPIFMVDLKVNARYQRGHSDLFVASS